MTELERFNLYWHCYAMTIPVTTKELYYFDGETKKFFVWRSGFLFDMVDLPLTASQAKALNNRLMEVDTETSEIVEIPRLNVQDKISV